MTPTLLELEQQIAELKAKYETEKTRVRETALEGIRAMLASGTITEKDLRELLPKPNPHRRKPGPKPKTEQQAAA